MDEDKVDSLAIEAWKKTVDVQQHFNEICMKIRNVFATLIAGLCALIGILETRAKDIMIPAFGYEIHGVLFVFLGIFGISMLFYFVDRHWYHRLLVGSVMSGLDVEQYLSQRAPGFSLTSKIGDNSALDITKCTVSNWILFLLAKVLFAEVTEKEGKYLLRSDAKLAIFYKSVAYLSVIAFLFFAWAGGIVAVPTD
ncbi:hypothetical protein [Ruegeria sp. HKCCA0235A]|uniref:hypothetical protein n=1 Tax=Ruegeria sp. HKCCA0235A TaxID=2682998 RepID=UPI001489241C|nr:hypothetical protein [Ruegeria sp. HKCCA0235A]